MQTSIKGGFKFVAFPLTPSSAEATAGRPALSPRERENNRQSQRKPMMTADGGWQAKEVRRSTGTPLRPVTVT
jgi:hypothetical protein